MWCEWMIGDLDTRINRMADICGFRKDIWIPVGETYEAWLTRARERENDPEGYVLDESMLLMTDYGIYIVGLLGGMQISGRRRRAWDRALYGYREDWPSRETQPGDKPDVILAFAESPYERDFTRVYLDGLTHFPADYDWEEWD